jgi:flavodoxin
VLPIWLLLSLRGGLLVEQHLADDEKSEMMMSENRSLIAYFSRTGSTRAMARIIHLNVTAALHEIRTAEPYPLDYQEAVEQARRELETGTLPQLQARIGDMDEYKVIFLGFPVWWETMPMPVVSFLEVHDMRGKTIVPFCTHEGSGMGKIETELADLCAGAEIFKGLALRGDGTDEIESVRGRKAIAAWLESLGLLRLADKASAA